MHNIILLYLNPDYLHFYLILAAIITLFSRALQVALGKKKRLYPEHFPCESYNARLFLA